MVFGVEQSDLERLIELARKHDIANTKTNTSSALHIYDEYKLLTGREVELPHGKLLFDCMRRFNYEQIQTIQTIVHLGKEKDHSFTDPEDLFDDKLVSIRWSGDICTEILRLMATDDISKSLEKGLKLLNIGDKEDAYES